MDHEINPKAVFDMIKKKYDVKRKPLFDKIKGIDRQQQEEYFGVLRSRFSVGFSFLAATDGNSGGCINFTVTATTTKGMVVISDDGWEEYVKFSDIDHWFDHLYCNNDLITGDAKIEKTTTYANPIKCHKGDKFKYVRSDGEIQTEQWDGGTFSCAMSLIGNMFAADAVIPQAQIDEMVKKLNGDE